jgi:hypothetical protein
VRSKDFATISKSKSFGIAPCAQVSHSQVVRLVQEAEMGDMKSLIPIKFDVLNEVVGIGLSPVSGCTVMTWSSAQITGGSLSVSNQATSAVL